MTLGLATTNFAHWSEHARNGNKKLFISTFAAHCQDEAEMKGFLDKGRFLNANCHAIETNAAKAAKEDEGDEEDEAAEEDEEE